MRKVLQNQFFLLALALAIGLSVFALAAAKKMEAGRTTCDTRGCGPSNFGSGGELLWDVLSLHFATLAGFR